MNDAAEEMDSATLVYEDHPMNAPKQQLQTVASAPITPSEMLDRAVSSGASIEIVEKLMNLAERWDAAQARKAFDEAIANAKAELPPVLRNKTGHNQKRYADFAAIAKAADAVLPKHGLSYRFRSSQDDRIHVTCIVSHRAGHSEENTLAGPADTSGSKNAIQAIGSTLTYLQRYSLMQALGMAATDDDDARLQGNSTVTPEQAAQLATIIQEAGADINKVLTAFQIESLSDLPASRFDEAATRIRNAARRK